MLQNLEEKQGGDIYTRIIRDAMSAFHIWVAD